jgi:hypothetical protein
MFRNKNPEGENSLRSISLSLGELSEPEQSTSSDKYKLL